MQDFEFNISFIGKMKKKLMRLTDFVENYQKEKKYRQQMIP